MNITAANQVVYGRIKSHPRGLAARGLVGDRILPFMSLRDSTPDQISARPFLVYRRLSISEAGAMSVRWLIYDDRVRQYHRITSIATELIAAYDHDRAPLEHPLVVFDRPAIGGISEELYDDALGCCYQTVDIRVFIA